MPTTADRRRKLVPVLLLAAALTPLGATSVAAADAAAGKVVYESRCAFCHGMTGRGDGIAGSSLQPQPTNFTSPEYWSSSSPERMRGVIENGKPGTAMVSFKATLKPAEIEDLLAHIESFKPR